MNRVMVVYKALGRVLISPQSFGLSERPPKLLNDALCAMRQSLREELVEENELWSGDWLSCELAQDADQHPQAKAGAVVKKA
jgi:hypothetical protein